VFLALQKLGAGTASEVSEVSEVPRSQVYGAAEGLEERGLVETQQARPTVYRPVALSEARSRLLDQLAETGAETFEYLDAVRESADDAEQSEAIWLVHDTDAVTSRTVDLVEAAEDRLLYATEEPWMLDEELLATVAAAADRGVEVVVASANETVLAAAADRGLGTCSVPSVPQPNVSIGRVLLADDDTLLLSVVSSMAVEGTQEVAFWSGDSTFGAVLGEFIRRRFGNPFEDGERAGDAGADPEPNR
jgi:hypothetical protein